MRNENIDDHGDYRFFRAMAQGEQDAEMRRAAEKAALYYSDAFEARAVGMVRKASQYRCQARRWDRRYFHRRIDVLHRK